MDMLRYDNCWPVNQDDSTLLGSLLDEKRTIMLETDSPNAPTTNRWESFMWRVIHSDF
jgi:hypothetical protein